MDSNYLKTLKTNNENLILALGGEINPHLPLIESLSEVSPQPPVAVARRACILSHFAAAAFGSSKAIQEAAVRIKRQELWIYTSNTEKVLLDKNELSDQERTDCSWLPEAIQALAWTMGLVQLDNTQDCDDDLASHFPSEDPVAFISQARLISLSSIQSQADLLYRIHWYARHCRRSARECIFSESLIRERRRAVDWVYGVEVDWDNIPSDT